MAQEVTTGPVGVGAVEPAYPSHRPLESRPCAEVDGEVSRVLTEAGENALRIERRASLDAVIDLFLEKETIDGEQLMDVVRPPIEKLAATLPMDLTRQHGM